MWHFGFLRIDDLHREGYGRREIDRLVTAGELSRLRRGLYATPTVNAALAAVVARGARVGCLSAADLHGPWVPPTSGVHCYAPW